MRRGNSAQICGAGLDKSGREVDIEKSTIRAWPPRGTRNSGKPLLTAFSGRCVLLGSQRYGQFTGGAPDAFPFAMFSTPQRVFIASHLVRRLRLQLRNFLYAPM